MRCITTNYLYQKLPQARQSEVIELIARLSMSTEWVQVVTAGPDSELTAGDLALISSRPASHTIKHNGDTLYNLDDRSTLAFKASAGKLRCTGDYFLAAWDEEEELLSPGGIILSAKKREDVRWATVHAVGPKCGFGVGARVLLLHTDLPYVLEVDGHRLSNFQALAVIAVED